MIKKLKQLFILLTILVYNSITLNGQNTMDSKLIFSDDKGNKISLEDLEGVTGEYHWEVLSDKKISQKANKLHQEARALGGQGKLDQSIEKLQDAIKIAPEWPYPYYDLAFTFLLKKDFNNALKYYDLTNDLEPNGFFTSKTASWSLKKEQEGEFQEGLYLAFVQIEWMETDQEKIEIAKAIVEKYPTYTPAWKILAGKLENIDERKIAIYKGLALDADSQTRDNLIINKALVLNLEEKKEDAIKVLGELIFDPNTSPSNIEVAKFILSSMVRSED